MEIGVMETLQPLALYLASSSLPIHGHSPGYIADLKNGDLHI